MSECRINRGQLWVPRHAKKVYHVVRIDYFKPWPDVILIQKVGPTVADPVWVTWRWFEKAEMLEL